MTKLKSWQQQSAPIEQGQYAMKDFKTNACLTAPKDGTMERISLFDTLKSLIATASHREFSTPLPRHLTECSAQLIPKLYEGSGVDYDPDQMNIRWIWAVARDICETADSKFSEYDRQWQSLHKKRKDKGICALRYQIDCAASAFIAGVFQSGPRQKGASLDARSGLRTTCQAPHAAAVEKLVKMVEGEGTCSDYADPEIPSKDEECYRILNDAQRDIDTWVKYFCRKRNSRNSDTFPAMKELLIEENQVPHDGRR